MKVILALWPDIWNIETSEPPSEPPASCSILCQPVSIWPSSASLLPLDTKPLDLLPIFLGVYITTSNVVLGTFSTIFQTPSSPFVSSGCPCPSTSVSSKPSISTSETSFSPLIIFLARDPENSLRLSFGLWCKFSRVGLPLVGSWLPTSDAFLTV